jgi:hypothetical protein
MQVEEGAMVDKQILINIQTIETPIEDRERIARFRRMLMGCCLPVKRSKREKGHELESQERNLKYSKFYQ